MGETFWFCLGVFIFIVLILAMFHAVDDRFARLERRFKDFEEHRR